MLDNGSGDARGEIGRVVDGPAMALGLALGGSVLTVVGVSLRFEEEGASTWIIEAR